MYGTCNNCDSHCFPTPTGCVEWRGNTHKDLSIFQGDSVETVIEALIAEVKRLGDIVDDCSFCNGSGGSSGQVSNVFPAPKYGVGNNYVQNVYDVQSIPFAYDVARLETNHKINYDLTSFQNNLPVGSEVRDVDVTVVSEKEGQLSNTVYSSTEKIGGFEVKPSSLPATMTVKTRLRSGEGDIVLNKIIALTGSEEGSFKAFFEATTSNPTPQELTAEQYNDILSGEISKLQRKVETLESKI